MSDPTSKIDPSKIDVPNQSKDNLIPAKLNLGIGDDASIKRIVFRLNYVESLCAKRKEILREGNLAQLEAEVYISHVIIQDLVDVVRELATLCAVSAFRQEQGIASPPNPQASGDDNHS